MIIFRLVGKTKMSLWTFNSNFIDMSFLKISVSISVNLSRLEPLQQNNILRRFLKSKHLNLNVRRNHTVNTSLYDTSYVQKYLKFLEYDYSKKDFAPPNTVKNIINLLKTKRDLETELKSLEEMSSEGSKELEELIKIDKEKLLNLINNLKNQIIDAIKPVDDDNNRNVELQIVPNIGGDEAKLFSKELFNMYFNYVNYKNWEHIVDHNSSYLYISGDNIYGKLRYEMGIHRVQRVPETETMGRTHTSTCTVLVLPQPRPGEIVFNEKEIIIETMRSSGPGGQNVNKTESCVRITHKPTGIIVENQTSRFQYENRKIALEKLKGIIFSKKQEELNSKLKELKKQHVATNVYSDKIRTYNFNQNRVTDHRLQFTVHNIKGFLSGGKELDRMVETLRNYINQEKLKFHIQDVLESEKYKKYESQNSN